MMASKEQTHSDRTSSKQRPPKPVSKDLNTLAQQSFHPATIIQRASRDPRSLTPRDVLQLQRTVGNRAVTQLLATVSAGQPRPAIQAKLTVGPAGDSYEQEADRVAAQVLSMPAPTSDRPAVQRQEEEEELQAKPLAATITPLVQRQAGEEEEIQARFIQRQEEEEEELQTKPDPLGSFEAGSDVESRLAAHKGGGSPLPGETREFMEPRFGADFSGVRVHSGGEALQLNQQLGSQAFTHGQDIYLGEGKANLDSDEGKHLVAHELTHVVQQTGAAIQRSPLPLRRLTAKLPITAIQRETKRTEKRAIASATATATPDTLTAGGRAELLEKLTSKDQSKKAARRIAAEIEAESQLLVNQIVNVADRQRVIQAIENYVADSNSIQNDARTNAATASQNVLDLDFALNTIRAQLAGGEKRRIVYRSISYKPADGGVGGIPYGLPTATHPIDVGDFVGDIAFQSTSEHRQFVLGKTQTVAPPGLVRFVMYSFSGVPIALHFFHGATISYDNANEQMMFDQENNSKNVFAKAWNSVFSGPRAGQAEILFARDTVFKVTQIDRHDTDNYVAVVLEEHRGARPAQVKGAKFGEPI